MATVYVELTNMTEILKGIFCRNLFIYGLACFTRIWVASGLVDFLKIRMLLLKVRFIC